MTSLTRRRRLAWALNPGVPVIARAPEVRWTRGVLQGVNSDGTVMVAIDGDTSPLVAYCHTGYKPNGGDIVDVRLEGRIAIVHDSFQGPPGQGPGSSFLQAPPSMAMNGVMIGTAPDPTEQLIVESGFVSGTTNGSGVLTFSPLANFSIGMNVHPANGGESNPFVNFTSSTLTSVQVTVYNPSGATRDSTAVNFSYVIVGA